MQVSGTSAGRKLDLRDYCGKLILKPSTEDEMIFLAFLHNAMLLGGKITVKLSAKANKVSKRKGSMIMEYKGG